MASSYDEYYKTENLFGNPYPELIDFFATYPGRGRVLDLGCGQGRDAIPLARLGYEVVGVDVSSLGIEQMLAVTKGEGLPLTGKVTDIYAMTDFSGYDFILLDSMFHFTKKDRSREIQFIQRILANSDEDCLFIFCVQDTGQKVQILHETLDAQRPLTRLVDQALVYVFEDAATGHQSKSPYRLLVVHK